jgi:hypothetical protein
MTELSFLIELLLNHDLPKATKDLIAERIKEVESKLYVTQSPKPALQQVSYVTGPQQAPSTLAAMARHENLPPIIPAPEMPPIPPVEHIAQTAATAAAINHRNEVIAAALSRKIDKQSGRPRKW